MTFRRLGLAALLLIWAGSSLAADPGAASGRYDHDGVGIALSHALALAQDNAEGLLEHPAQMRILLSDRDVPIQALYGAIFPPVRAMASRGEVRGVLLEFDPTDRTKLSITPLAKPDDPTATLTTISRSDSNGVWRQLTITATSVAGDYQDDDTGLKVVFNAPLAADPVVADLKGLAARSSEQVRVLAARAEALGRGDLAAAAALTARQSSDDLKSMPPDQLKAMSPAMSAEVRQLKAIQRVVVRQHTAVALLSADESASLVFEDGQWKVAD
jgi:hypothetical protein